MSKRSYFGTDGIRGQANRHPMTAEVALRVGLAAGKLFRRDPERRHLVVIGKDTRLSGYMLEPALVAGFASVGMDVRLFGPLPTPAVAMMTRSMRADLGVMISASHNTFSDNGIKLFGPDGYKLSDARELEIEELMDEGLQEGLAAPTGLGRVQRIDDAQARYVEIVKATFPRSLTLSGLRALDGDTDRLAICDERGLSVDGDQIMALIAGAWASEGRLSGGGVVATVMSNLGFERFLHARQIALERTQVGDRYVMERMREGGFNLGGEASGHVILSDFSTTGDGLIAALQVLSVMVTSGKPMSALARQFEPVPQKLVNVRFAGGEPLKSDRVQQAITEGERRLNGSGRVLVRASGTEPLIRVMAEGDDDRLVAEVVHDIAGAVREVAASTHA